ncbi:MAG: NAD(P)-dependent glycerol-3-phosphate dehydrogenase [Legionellales bacterium]|nr:NAD(P)-dependent glycerol-3-phosphate dehydrogenase [Legionellales bacterium]
MVGNNNLSSSIAVLGAGSWGTALAIALARKHHQVFLWGRDASHIANLQQTGCNQKYLPNANFPANLIPHADLEWVLQHVVGVLIVIPSHGFSACLAQLKPLLKKHHQLAFATKGLDPDSGKFLHELVIEYLGQRDIAVLSGPSFAAEVAEQKPTAVTIAANSLRYAQQWQAYFHTPYFRVYTSTDLVGVAIGGAVKNVLAIAVGISDGLGFGMNARAGLMTRGFTEMRRLGKALGAEEETLLNLAGLGDLILTCSDNQSRNRRFGIALGEGKSLIEAKQMIARTIEGINTSQEIFQLATQYQIEMPICEQVFQVLYHHQTVQKAVQTLLARIPKDEN